MEAVNVSCFAALLFSVFLVQFIAAGSEDVNPKKTSFEDARCKCVCPKFKSDNKTESEKTIYISSNADPNNCNCDFVVKKPVSYCSACECKFENRNTTTIKVVVIIIICVILMLLVYMLFLLCLDPLIAHRPSNKYQEHTDEDDQSVSQVPQFDGSSTRPRLAKQKSVINYVSDEQKRWKSTVQEQRKNIYDKHTMLN